MSLMSLREPTKMPSLGGVASSISNRLPSSESSDRCSLKSVSEAMKSVSEAGSSVLEAGNPVTEAMMSVSEAEGSFSEAGNPVFEHSDF